MLVYWYENAAGGRSWTRRTLALPPASGVEMVAVADFSGDGDLDLAVAGPAGQTRLWSFENAAGDGTSSILGTVSATLGHRALNVADVDRDGNVDILAHGMPPTGATLTWFEQPRERLVPAFRRGAGLRGLPRTGGGPRRRRRRRSRRSARRVARPGHQLAGEPGKRQRLDHALAPGERLRRGGGRLRSRRRPGPRDVPRHLVRPRALREHERRRQRLGPPRPHDPVPQLALVGARRRRPRRGPGPARHPRPSGRAGSRTAAGSSTVAVTPILQPGPGNGDGRADAARRR